MSLHLPSALAMSCAVAVGSGCGNGDGIDDARAPVPRDRSYPLTGQAHPILFVYRGGSVTVRLMGSPSDVQNSALQGRAVVVSCGAGNDGVSTRSTTWTKGRRQIDLRFGERGPENPTTCRLTADGLGEVASALMLPRDLDRTLARDDKRFEPPRGALGGAERGVEFVYRNGRLTVTLTDRAPPAVVARTMAEMPRVGCGPVGGDVKSRLVEWPEGDRRITVRLGVPTERVGRCLLETTRLRPLASARMRPGE